MRERALEITAPQAGGNRLRADNSLIVRVTDFIDRRAKLILILLVVFGFLGVIRTMMGNTMIVKQISSDPWTIASNIYQGKGYSACSTSYFPSCDHILQPTAMREPVPVLIFLVSMLVYPHPISGFITEAIFYISMIFLLYFSLRGRSRSFALIAAILWTVSVPVMQEVGDGSGDLEAAFFVACGLLFFQRGRSSKRLLDWGLSGLFLGLAALSRSVLLPLIPALGIGLLLERALGSLQRRLVQAATVMILAGLVLSPWVIRNQMVFGEPIVGTTLTGYNLYRDNYFIAQPGWWPHYVGAKEARDAVHKLVAGSALTGNENEAQVQAFYQKQALSIIIQHPIDYLAISAFRILPLWFNSTVKYSYGEKLNLADAIMVIEQLFLLGTAVLGAWLNRRSLWPYVVSLILVVGAYMAVTAQLRYLIDVMPLVVILSASAFLAPERQAKEKSGDKPPLVASIMSNRP